MRLDGKEKKKTREKKEGWKGRVNEGVKERQKWKE